MATPRAARRGRTAVAVRGHPARRGGQLVAEILIARGTRPTRLPDPTGTACPAGSRPAFLAARGFLLTPAERRRSLRADRRAARRAAPRRRARGARGGAAGPRARLRLSVPATRGGSMAPTPPRSRTTRASRPTPAWSSVRHSRCARATTCSSRAPEHHPLVGGAGRGGVPRGTPLRPRPVHGPGRAPRARRRGAGRSLGYTPPWLDRGDGAGGRGWLRGHPIGDGGDGRVFRGLDPGRVARARARDFSASGLVGVLERRLAWTAIAYPTARWADRGLRRAGRRAPLGRARPHPAARRADPAASWERRWDELEAARATS